MSQRPLVYIASPHRAAGRLDRALHRAYVEACVLDSTARGEAPFAVHLMLGDLLDDANPVERAAGMATGAAWLARADRLALYCDLGESEGMRGEWAQAKSLGIPVERRSVEGWASR